MHVRTTRSPPARSTGSCRGVTHRTRHDVDAEASDDDRFLGVDGGGTKTALSPGRRARRYWWRRRIPRRVLLLQPDGIDLVGRVLQAGGGRASARQARISPPGRSTTRSSGCPATARSPRDIRRWTRRRTPLLGHDRYRCDNDMVCGWAGSLAAADGINVVSGTGSMTYGERHGHRRPRRRMGRAVRRRGLGLLDRDPRPRTPSRG